MIEGKKNRETERIGLKKTFKNFDGFNDFATHMETIHAHVHEAK